MALLAVSGWSIGMNVVVLVLSLLLMLIVLIQRGKGGGLAGAFGGAGGSSPFGSRAGDAFTKITLYLFTIWMLAVMIHVKVAQRDRDESGVVSTVVTPGG